MQIACAINGRFLGAPQTGVQRVAHELCAAFGAMAARFDPAVAGIAFEVWVPPALVPQARTFGLPVRAVGAGGGNVWEQTALAMHDRGRVLLNLCNVGPVLRRNCVTMIHDAQVFQTPASYALPFRLWYRFAQRRLARPHRAIVTVSRYSAGELVRFGITPTAAPAVHNGCDHVLRLGTDAPALATLGLAPRGYVLASASTMAHKNVGTLLRAFADPALAGVPLVLYGSADRAAFDRAGLPLPPGVVFAGRITDARMRTLLEQALCLAFPSLTEGFGLPPLEAMRLGCPVVCSPAGALAEVCGTAAIYADAREPLAWSRAIAALRDDPALRQAHVRLGVAHAQAFTWERAAGAIADLLRSRPGAGPGSVGGAAGHPPPHSSRRRSHVF